MNYSKSLVVTAISVLVCLDMCVAAESIEMITKTSKPIPVDAQKDNSDVLQQTESGLIVSMVIDENKVIDFSTQFASISKSEPNNEDNESVKVSGMRGGVVISSMAIADQRVVAAERAGLIVIGKRTLVGRIAIPSRIDTLEVNVPGATRSQSLDVRQAFEKYCVNRVKEKICIK